MARWTRSVCRTAVSGAALLAVLGALDRQRARAVLGRALGRADGRRRAEARRGGGEERAPATAPADVPDDALLARVRVEAAIPHRVEVAVVDGAVVLFGRVPEFAIAPLLQRVAKVEGVGVVENRLTPARELARL